MRPILCQTISLPNCGRLETGRTGIWPAYAIVSEGAIGYTENMVANFPVSASAASENAERATVQMDGGQLLQTSKWRHNIDAFQRAIFVSVPRSWQQ